MTQTLTTEAMQEIYEAAVHSESTGDDQDAHFELLCKLEDVGGTGATIRKLIDMVRAANRDEQPVAYRYRYNGEHLASFGCGDLVSSWKYCEEVDLINPDERYERQALFSGPAAPAVPDEMKRDPNTDVFDTGFMNGWNACRNEIIKSKKD